MASAPADRHVREAARAPVESASTPPSPRLPIACDSGSVAAGEAVAPSGKARRKDSAAARRQRRIRSEARLRLQLTRDGALLASHSGGPQPESQPEVSLLRAEVALLRAEICNLRAAGSQVPSFRIAEPGEDSEAIPSDMDDQIWEVSFDAPDACSPTAIATLLDPSLDSDAPSNPSSLGDEGPHNEVAVAPEVPSGADTRDGKHVHFADAHALVEVQAVASPADSGSRAEDPESSVLVCGLAPSVVDWDAELRQMIGADLVRVDLSPGGSETALLRFTQPAVAYDFHMRYYGTNLHGHNISTYILSTIQAGHGESGLARVIAEWSQYYGAAARAAADDAMAELLLEEVLPKKQAPAKAVSLKQRKTKKK